MESGQAQARTMSLGVLRHPVRVRIIEACTDWGRLSPAEIVSRELCSDVESVRDKTPKQALSHIAYHCRTLAAAGLLRLVDEQPVRGAMEHFYAANSEALFPTEEWQHFSEGERRDISRVMWQRFIAQVENAMQQHTFDARKDRWLAWGPLDLDEEGWTRLMASVSACYDQIEQIRTEAQARLAQSGEPPLRATYGVFGFESPPRRHPTP